ncbi:MAG: hypothetical protein M2R45_03646 [Verrucomicrobia subdivision 3 bacterium]|nr:hypothetical protein [Limisphaerales bacterium]MCS1412724.1 hypothetical protein [Limisphaerales bacterium]
MLSLVIGFLTFILVVICAILMVLILVQLPKKDAGAGLAFGGGTAEAIFGAGASTPLAQITKYCAGIFLALALALSALNAYRSNLGDRLLKQEAARQAAKTPTTPATEPAPTEPPTVTPSGTEPETGETGASAEANQPEGEAAETPPKPTPATKPNPNN